VSDVAIFVMCGVAVVLTFFALIALLS